MALYTINQELNGIEISFETKPTADTIASLKANGYRWHRVKKLWYAKQTAARLALAQSIADGHSPQKSPQKAAGEVINLDNLGIKPDNFSYYGSELAALIRADLKKRGVSGVTVRARKVTHETGITVTVKATAADIASIEEYQKRYDFLHFSANAESYHGIFDGSRWIYAATWEEMSEEERREAYDSHTRYFLSKAPDFSNYHQKRNDYPTITTPFYNKLVAVFQIANQWNYNNSDSMTDYFDIGYFLDVDIKLPADYEVREEMTEDERTAYAAELKAEEEKKAAELKAYEEEQKRREEEHKKYKAWEAAALEKIANNTIVEDLEEPLYIEGIRGGIGKEATLQELRETLNEYDRAPEDAEITRAVNMSESAYNDFCELFMIDFDFLAGKGGTGSEDVRLKDFSMYQKLTPEQRETIKFYNSDCIGVFVDGSLKLVINPQGYNYARYVYIPNDDSTLYKAAHKLEEQKAESEAKPAFYIPETVKTQAENLHEGQQVTIYQCDGWLLSSIYAGSGTIESIKPGNYAQYTGLYITLKGIKDPVFIRDGRKCLIYEGIKPRLPETVTSRRINEHMTMLYNVDDLIPNTYNYYFSLGEAPILDTCPR